MFNSSIFDHYTVQREYRASPASFVRAIIEGVYSGQMSPHDFSIRDLASGIMGSEWLQEHCPTPHGVGGVPYQGSRPNKLNKEGNGGEFADRTPPNQRAAARFAFVRGGKLNKPLLESWANAENRLHKSSANTMSLLEEEAVKHSHFTNIVGQIFFNEILNWYKVEENKFTALVPNKGTTIMELERIGGTTTAGDVYDKPIPEAGLYPKFGVGENWIEVAPKQKRGGIIEVTKEAILGNNTGDLLDACKTYGEALGYNIENRIIDAIIDENAGAKSATQGGHRYRWRYVDFPSYQVSSPWQNKNTGNGLTNIDNMNTAWKSFKSMVDPASGEPIIFSPKQLLVSTANYLNALEIVDAKVLRKGDITSGAGRQSETDNLVTELIPGLKVISSQRFTSRTATDTDWFLTDIATAIRRMVVWDLTPEQYGAGTAADIYHDVVQILKFSLMDGISVVEPRALQLNVQ